jgi:hypothetical protein
MAERYDLAALDASLADLAAMVEFPATPPIATPVADRIRSGSLPGDRWFAAVQGWLRGGWLRRGWLPRGRLARGVALGLLAALLIAGAAVAVGIAIGGLRIVFSTETPRPLPSGAAAARAFGVEVSLDEARRRAGFTIVTPGEPTIGPPDHVFYLPSPRGGTISLVWGDRPGYPADPKTRIGLVLTEFRGDVGPEYWEKLIDGGTRVQATTVRGAAAYWVAGGTHFFFYRDAAGHEVDTTLRLVGTALVWQQGGLTLRVEGAHTLEAARRIATSIR